MKILPRDKAYLTRVPKPVSLTELLKWEKNEFEQDFNCFGLIKKIIVQGGTDVWKILILIPNEELVCVEFQDRGFVKVGEFPKVLQYVFLDNLKYVSSTRIDHRDLSFEVQDELLN
jgi:hypothetical protein